MTTFSVRRRELRWRRSFLTQLENYWNLITDDYGDLLGYKLLEIVPRNPRLLWETAFWTLCALSRQRFYFRNNINSNKCLQHKTITRAKDSQYQYTVRIHIRDIAPDSFFSPVRIKEPFCTYVRMRPPRRSRAESVVQRAGD